jgi:hypothetical protein
MKKPPSKISPTPAKASAQLQLRWSIILYDRSEAEYEPAPVHAAGTSGKRHSKPSPPWKINVSPSSSAETISRASSAT